MRTYVLRRVTLIIPTIFLVSIVVFALIRAIPGDVVTLMLQDSKDPQQAEQLRQQLGLDKPVVVQYGIWLGHAVQGDLGTSLWTKNSVGGEISRALPVTLELAIISMLIASLLAIPFGLISALMQNRFPDYLVRVISITGLSIPNFWLGTLLIMLPAIWFRWSPPTTYVSIFVDPVQNLKQFMLPSLSLGYGFSAITMRLMRSETLEVMRQDYIRTAQAKGLASRALVVRHILRNALIPVITVMGAQARLFLGGAVLIEQIFLLPGLGRLTLWAIQVRDYPQLQANILIIVIITLLLNLLTDLSYGWLDPRVRLA
jgi:peptide/nickel transport system permease protein